MIIINFQFTEESEALEHANDCDRGLAAYLYSKDPGQIHRVSSALESGRN